MNLRIGIDGRPLVGQLSGVGKYVLEICKELDHFFPTATFFIYSPHKIILPVQKPNWISRIEPNPWAKRLKPVLWLKFFSGKLIKEDSLDVFWGTSHFLPNLPKNVRSVLTIHDIVYKIAPKTMPTGNFIAHRLFFKSDAQKADFRVANSTGTKTRFESTYRLPVHSIAKPCASDVFRKIPTEELNIFLQNNNINFPYFLTVATWEPRKNLMTLIKAFNHLKANLPELNDFKLLLVGGMGWKQKKLQKSLNEDFYEDVIPLGYVPEDQLPYYYSGAKGFLFPSTYEGFGMPVLEARLCGTPIVTTDIPELREAGGKQAIYIRPDFPGIQEGIKKIVQNNFHFYQEILPEPGWKECAETYKVILEKFS